MKPAPPWCATDGFVQRRFLANQTACRNMAAWCRNWPRANISRTSCRSPKPPCAKPAFPPSALDAVAATQGPGLAIALLVGFKAAQAVAFALDKPFIGINHHEAHLYSPWIQSAAQAPERRRARPVLSADFSAFQPNVSLIVSGGHTLLVHVRVRIETSRARAARLMTPPANVSTRPASSWACLSRRPRH